MTPLITPLQRCVKTQPATRANVEMAIEMLALPELEKVQSELAEAKDKFAKMSKFLSNPIFSKEVK